MPGGREIYSEWSLIYQLSPGYILLCGHSELIMLSPGDGRVISRVLMVRARVCHWLMTIKSPLIWADHCWLLSFSALTLAVQCPVRECGARSRLEPGPAPATASTGQPGQEPPVLSLLTHWPLWSPHSSLYTRATAHEILWAANPCPAAGHPCHYPGQDWVPREMSRPTTWTEKVGINCHQTSKVQTHLFYYPLKTKSIRIQFVKPQVSHQLFTSRVTTTNNASETITDNLTRLLI